MRRPNPHAYTERRPMGLAPWKPQARSLALAQAIEDVLDEYRDYWPLTARQVFYRLVGKGVVSKSQGMAAQVQRQLERGRRSGRWPWAAIRDDGSTATDLATGFDGLPSFLDALRSRWRTYARDRHAGQATRVVLWCESAGMAPSLRSAVDDLPVRVVSGGGAPSVTLLRNEAMWIANDKRPTVLLYVGDLDKHGLMIEDRVADDLDAFLRDFGAYHAKLQFKTIAVTDAQVQSLNLPDDPSSPGSYQAEAIPPDELERIVRDACEAELDSAKLAEIARQEWFDRLNLARKLRNL